MLGRLVDGPAGTAGLQPGDRLLEYKGKLLTFSSLTEMNDFWKIEVANLKVGDTMHLQILRGLSRFTTALKAGVVCGKIPVEEDVDGVLYRL